MKVSGMIEYDKVEVWNCNNGYRLRIMLKSPVYGDICLHSEFYDDLREADSRAVVVAQQLGLRRDTLPVHCSAEEDAGKPI